MNFFEQELRKLFADGMVIDDPHFIGRACFGVLGSDLRAKAEFVTQDTVDQYEAIRITILNRSDGVVDSLTMHFDDLFGRKRSNSSNLFNRISPYFWQYDGKYGWYGYKPSAADYADIRYAVNGYLSVFREKTRQPKRTTPKHSRDAR